MSKSLSYLKEILDNTGPKKMKNITRVHFQGVLERGLSELEARREGSKDIELSIDGKVSYKKHEQTALDIVEILDLLGWLKDMKAGNGKVRRSATIDDFSIIGGRGKNYTPSHEAGAGD